MSKNHILKVTVLSLSLLLFLSISYLRSLPDGFMHVVFCDVGQGDAIYIKFPDGKDMLVDGGGNKEVLNCLGNHMAFYDRKLELVVLTHPQHDHYNGLIDVLKRYEVDRVVANAVDNKAKSYQEFKELIKDKNIPVSNVYHSDRISLDSETDIEAVILSPDHAWVTQRIDDGNSSSYLLNKNVLGIATDYDDLNDFSIVMKISYEAFDLLLTGDAEAELIHELVESGKIVSNDIEVFKVGHHGAKAGLSQTLAEEINPDLTVISVGKKNSYGHPAAEVLDILSLLEIPVKRTDLDGEVEVVSDGERWWIED